MCLEYLSQCGYLLRAVKHDFLDGIIFYNDDSQALRRQRCAGDAAIPRSPQIGFNGYLFELGHGWWWGEVSRGGRERSPGQGKELGQDQPVRWQACRIGAAAGPADFCPQLVAVLPQINYLPPKATPVEDTAGGVLAVVGGANSGADGDSSHGERCGGGIVCGECRLLGRLPAGQGLEPRRRRLPPDAHIMHPPPVCWPRLATLCNNSAVGLLAAAMMLESKWAGQVGQRARRLSQMMATGKDPAELLRA
jgi:hypothetical protein